ncbi:DUF4293 domain-containing protein [Flavobacterium orientale]|uniref:Transcription termination factor Rho n=1 Tax=Flavobacterium orientale TaxID=1756020 RepID=A0A916Y1C3_9FLAO|nr:DUF4293 domain-containing protein [Flavobacterium orientale]GGD25929.1 hypothetical protein GCM10011343_15070 [Flavobacterium orientale]
MFQRIQTVYLIAAIISSGILPFFLPLWHDSNRFPIYFDNFLGIAILFIFSAVLSVIAINLYKKRRIQSVLCLLNIVLNLILLGLLLFYSLNVSGDIDISEKGIGLGLPVLSIVVLALANNAIKKDEKLVKSSNRIR